MPGNRDDKTGKYTKQFPDEAFLNAVSALDTPTTTNVANHVGCSYDLAYRRLHEYFEAGKIGRVEVGNTFLWQSH